MDEPGAAPLPPAPEMVPPTEEAPPPPDNTNIILAVVIVGILLTVAFTAYYLYNQPKTTQATSSPQSTTASHPATASPPPTHQSSPAHQISPPPAHQSSPVHQISPAHQISPPHQSSPVHHTSPLHAPVHHAPRPAPITSITDLNGTWHTQETDNFHHKQKPRDVCIKDGSKQIVGERFSTTIGFQNGRLTSEFSASIGTPTVDHFVMRGGLDGAVTTTHYTRTGHTTTGCKIAPKAPSFGGF